MEARSGFSLWHVVPITSAVFILIWLTVGGGPSSKKENSVSSLFTIEEDSFISPPPLPQEGACQRLCMSQSDSHRAKLPSACAVCLGLTSALPSDERPWILNPDQASVPEPEQASVPEPEQASVPQTEASSSGVPVSLKIEDLFQVYSQYHSRCMQKYPGLGRHPVRQENMTCSFLIYTPTWSGLGNALMGIASAFVYALLNKRVLLIDFRGIVNVSAILEEPFAGSSWKIPQEMNFGDAFKIKDVESRKLEDDPELHAKGSLYMEVIGSGNEIEYDWLTCGNVGSARDDSFISNFRWIVLKSNEYFLPALFVNPMYRAILSDIFPDRLPLPILLKRLMLPTAAVWTKVESILSTMKENSTTIGLQVRWGDGYFLDSAAKCLMREGAERKKAKHPASRGAPVYIYIATISKNVVPWLESHFANRSDLSEDDFPNVRIIHGGSWEKEIHSEGQWQDALADMMVLSKMESLIITGHSTFGYIARAFHGKGARIMSWSCPKFSGVDGCYHSPPKGICGKSFEVKDVGNATRGMIEKCEDCENCWKLKA